MCKLTTVQIHYICCNHTTSGTIRTFCQRCRNHGGKCPATLCFQDKQTHVQRSTCPPCSTRAVQRQIEGDMNFQVSEMEWQRVKAVDEQRRLEEEEAQYGIVSDSDEDDLDVDVDVDVDVNSEGVVADYENDFSDRPPGDDDDDDDDDDDGDSDDSDSEDEDGGNDDFRARRHAMTSLERARNLWEATRHRDRSAAESMATRRRMQGAMNAVRMLRSERVAAARELAAREAATARLFRELLDSRQEENANANAAAAAARVRSVSEMNRDESVD